MFTAGLFSGMPASELLGNRNGKVVTDGSWQIRAGYIITAPLLQVGHVAFVL